MKGEIHDERSNVDRTKKEKKAKKEAGKPFDFAQGSRRSREAEEIQNIEVELTDAEILKQAEEREKVRKAEEEAEKEAEKEEEKEEKAKERKEKHAKKATVRVKPRHGKKYLEIEKKVEKDKLYNIGEAIDLALETSPSKFDATVELHVRLHVKEANIRGTVNMPGGLVREKNVLEVDLKNVDDVVEKVKAGKIDFDIMVASASVMPKLAVLAKVLGPKGLMPSPKAGTIVDDVKAAAEEIRSGKVEYRADKQNIVHIALGKISFGTEKIKLNYDAILGKLPKRIESIYLTTTMGPSIKVAKK